MTVMVKLICPNCGKEFEKRISNCCVGKDGTYSACSRSCNGIISRNLQMGIEVDFSKNVKEIYEIPNKDRRTGKICEDKSSGYLYIYSPDHPLANQTGLVYLHRLIASQKEGRWILPEEQVHHIDKNRKNNDPDNLKVLSASEHAKLHMTEKYGEKKVCYCEICKKELIEETKTGLCFNCYNKLNRKFDVSKEELEKLVWEYPTIKVANIFGVSDKAIEKRCKLMGIEKPPRGYWRKLETGKL